MSVFYIEGKVCNTNKCAIQVNKVGLKATHRKLKTIKKYFSNYCLQKKKNCSLAFLHCSWNMNNARSTGLIKKKA